MFKEFKTFIARGNVLDLAVGIVIGVAFGAIVTSFVNDVLMPPVGLLLKGVDFTNLFVVMKGTLPDGATLAEAKAVKGVVTLNYGLFLNAVINFLIVAFAVFLVVKAANRMMPKPAPAPEPAKTKGCPFCAMDIPLAAARCPHCTSEL